MAVAPVFHHPWSAYAGREPLSARKGKTPAELLADKKRRNQAFQSFPVGMVESFSEMNRKEGGEGNVTGIAVH